MVNPIFIICRRRIQRPEFFISLARRICGTTNAEDPAGPGPSFQARRRTGIVSRPETLPPPPQYLKYLQKERPGRGPSIIITMGNWYMPPPELTIEAIENRNRAPGATMVGCIE